MSEATQKSAVREQAKGYTVRAPGEWAGSFETVAAELGWSGGQLAAEAARALVQMVDSDSLEVPEVVTMARTLRAQNATLISKRRPFPGAVSMK